MIIVAGESLIDMLPVDGGGKRMFLPAVGGSPYNVAMALGRLGVPVRFMCRLSQDPFGTLLARTLEESHVNITLCPRTEALSTLGFVMMDNDKRTPSYVFYTENTAGCAMEPADIPDRLGSEVRCLHFGSVSLAAEPIGQALEKLLSLRTPQTFVSVDPNIRPFLVKDRASFVQRLGSFLDAANVIKLSEEDMQWLHPSFTVADCCEHYVTRGAGMVVVTRGENGAFAMNAAGAVEVAAEPVSVVDTVGAGDTFQAALLAWMLWEHGLRPDSLRNLGLTELRDLLRFGAKAAAITCSRAGCNPPWRNEVKADTSFTPASPAAVVSTVNASPNA